MHENNDALQKEIVKLLAKEKILEVLANYTRGLDRCDEELLSTVYHDDATDYHGIFDGPANDFIEIALKTQRKKLYSSHLLGQSKVEFVDGGAFAETYFWSSDLTEHPLPGMTLEGEGPFLTFMSGRYADWFEDRGTGWRIAERKVVIDWVHGTPLKNGGFPMTEVFHQSLQSRLDPAYGERES